MKVEQVAKFKEECLLARSVGLEVLGRLLYCAYNENESYFEPEKVSKIAQLDWSREGHTWQNNIVLSNPNQDNTPKSYKITASANAVRMAINAAKVNLGWM